MRAEQSRDMATYNQWMNQRLYAVCAELSDMDRRKDRGVFFKSIHGTLNHLLLADKIWLGRFFGRPFHVDSLDQELYHDFGELRCAREQTDGQILRWAGDITDEVLAGTLHYTSVANPTLRSYEMWLAVAHFLALFRFGWNATPSSRMIAEGTKRRKQPDERSGVHTSTGAHGALGSRAG